MTGDVQAILFDFYGTLARAVTWGPRLEDVLAARGFVLDPDVLERWRAEAADGIDHGERSVDRETYVAWERARLRRLVDTCGAGADAEACVKALYAATKAYTLTAYDEVPGVLATVRSAGITVAVCSNWDWDLDRALAATGLDGLVDVVVTSAQAGARKPHPRIYRQTLERCGVEPGDAVFVGDTWAADVEGPSAVGMRPVHVWRADNGEREAPPPGSVPRVADLRGVLDLVSRP